MMLKVVLIGSDDADARGGLVQALRKRHHHVVYLSTEAHEQPRNRGAARPAAGSDATPDSLFRSHTGTVRKADIIIVTSGVACRTAVVNWVLDQARGVVAYCHVERNTGDGHNMTYVGGGELPWFDFYLSTEPGASSEQHVTALENHVSTLTAHAQ